MATRKTAQAEKPPAKPPRPWPADNVERWPLDRIVPYPRNPMLHDADQVNSIKESMRTFGVTAPVLVDENGVLIYGHGRRMAAVSLLSEGLNEFGQLPVVVARGWTEDEKKAYRIADNQLGRSSEWDMPQLKAQTMELKAAGFKLALLGFPKLQLVQFTSGLGNGGAGDGDNTGDVDRGALLELVDITIADPRSKVERGDHFVLSERHHLVCAGVVSDWPKWVSLLRDGALFCPYPGVFVPFGTKAEKHALIMVQPDTYIAGHILDRWKEVEGADSVQKVNADG